MTSGQLELRGITRATATVGCSTTSTSTCSPGRLTGFVGGNGAGKTTTMRIVLGVLAADAGTVMLDGAPLGPDDRRRFGYMPEERGLYPQMKVARADRLPRAAARLRAGGRHGRRHRAARATRARRAAERQRRDAVARQPAARPDRRRARARPPGADPRRAVLGPRPPRGRRRRRRAAGAAPRRRCAILFSSHQLDVVERLCDDLVIIAGGTIRAAGSRESLRTQHSTSRYELLSAGDAGWLRAEPGVEVVDFDGGYALFDVDAGETAQRVLRRRRRPRRRRQLRPAASVPRPDLQGGHPVSTDTVPLHRHRPCAPPGRPHPRAAASGSSPSARSPRSCAARRSSSRPRILFARCARHDRDRRLRGPEPGRHEGRRDRGCSTLVRRSDDGSRSPRSATGPRREKLVARRRRRRRDRRRPRGIRPVRFTIVAESLGADESRAVARAGCRPSCCSSPDATDARCATSSRSASASCSSTAAILRLDDRAERRRGEADPRRRDPDLGDPARARCWPAR